LSAFPVAALYTRSQPGALVIHDCRQTGFNSAAPRGERG